VKNYHLYSTDEQDTLVRFKLTGADLDPALVTAALGIAPSESWKKGDLKRGSRTLPPYTFGMWQRNAPCSPSDPFDDQLPRLLDQLEALLPQLHTVAQFNAALSIASSFGPYQIGFYLNTPTVARLAALNLSIDIDLYPHGMPDDEEADQAENASSER
jgi:hypothetical protein